MIKKKTLQDEKKQTEKQVFQWVIENQTKHRQYQSISVPFGLSVEVFNNCHLVLTASVFSVFVKRQNFIWNK